MRSRSNLLVLLGIAFFVVGGVIVFMLTSDDDGGGGSGAEARVTAVVATTDIPAGALADELIDEGKLDVVEVPSGQLAPGALGSLNQLAGATFVQGFAANQQITGVGVQLRTRTFEIPEGFEAVAVQLEFVPGGAAYVSPGDRINLYGTGGGEAQSRAELLLTNVEVLDVDLTIAPRRGSTTDPSAASTPRTSSEAVTYLLALRTDDVEKVVFMTEFAGLYATLTAEEAPPAGPTEGRDATNIFEEEPNVAFGG
ncbi:MAG: RcpC/CpaB family pilus assembly protein [Acidimicrobiales bacterium]